MNFRFPTLPFFYFEIIFIFLMYNHIKNKQLGKNGG
jgi:hypothetical protein